MLKTKKEEMVMIDRPAVERLKEMFSSPDVENHQMGFRILENIDIKANLPYVLIIHKQYKDNASPNGWAKITEKIEKVLKKLGCSPLGRSNYDKIFNIVKEYYTTDDLQMVLDHFRVIMIDKVSNWGFKLLNKCTLKLEV